MKRSHRVAHRLIWPILVLAVGVGFSMALALRPPIPIETGVPRPAPP